VASTSWRKSTWLPSGAGGFALVKPLEFRESPAPLVKVHAEPVGRY
jgi:hypothetical protein